MAMKLCDEAFGRPENLLHPFTRASKRRAGPGGISFEAQLNLTVPRIPTRSPGLGGPQAVTGLGGDGGGDTGLPPHGRAPWARAGQALLLGHSRRGTGSYLRIWASCCPPPPRGPRRSRTPAGPSDGAPCSPARRDPAARTGRSNAAAAAPWPRTGEEGRWAGGSAARDRAQARRPGRAGRLRLARLSWARPGRALRGEERGSALKPRPGRSAGFSEEKPLIPPRPSRAAPRAPNGRGWRSAAPARVRTGPPLPAPPPPARPGQSAPARRERRLPIGGTGASLR